MASATASMVSATTDLVRHLGGLTNTRFADKGNVLAHEGENRHCSIEILLAAAHHDGQRRGLGADFAAGDGRVKIAAAQFGYLPGKLAGLDRRNRAHVDDEMSGGKTLDNTVSTEKDFGHLRRVGHHDNGDLACGGNLSGRADDGQTAIQQLGRSRIYMQGTDDIVPAREQVPGHWRAHYPQSNEPDLHDCLPGRTSLKGRHSTGLQRRYRLCKTPTPPRLRQRAPNLHRSPSEVNRDCRLRCCRRPPAGGNHAIQRDMCRGHGGGTEACGRDAGVVRLMTTI